MSRFHPSSIDLEAYVLGALAEDEANEIEAHVVSCEVCAAALAREACLEMALERVAQDVPLEAVVISAPRASVAERRGATNDPRVVPIRSAGRVGAVAGAVVGALAIAASAVLWLGTPPRGSYGLPSAAAGHPEIEMAADAAETLAVLPAAPLTSDSLDGG